MIHSGCLFGRWADAFVRIGDASYSTYLTHLLAALRLPGIPPLGRVLVALLLGIVVHVFVVHPLGAWFSNSHRRSNGLAPSEPVAA